jgi:hypothetical protein
VIRASLLLAAAVARAAAIDVTCGNDAGDAAKLNGAIQASAAGDAIAIHGRCLLTGTVALKGSRSYIGDSRTGTILRQADGADLPAVMASESWMENAKGTGTPMRVAHLTVDGNRARNRGTHGLLIRSWLTAIEDVQVRDAPGDGIRLVNTARDGETRLTSTQVNGRISGCFINNSGGNGIRVDDPGNAVTDWDLLDCWIAGSGESAVRLDNAAGWKIKGVHIYGVKQHAIYARRCYSTTIADNLIEGFGENGGEENTWYGIACTAQGGSASVITGNKVFRLNAKTAGAKFVFIGIPQVNYGTGMVNVVNNVIRGAGSELDIGLSYRVGGAEGLMVLSAMNNVQAVGTERVVDEKATLVAGQ